MAGVRETKKTLTRESILTAAVHCFGSKGYDATRIEDIAELAEIAVGTVYNYYPSKRELLFAVLEGGLEARLAAGAKVVSARIEDPADSVVKLLSVYADGLTETDRRIWREGVALILNEGNFEQSPWLAAYEELKAQIRDLLLRCRQQGMLAQIVSLDTAVQLAVNAFATQALRYAATPGYDLPALKEALRREIYLTFRGLR